MHQQLVVVSEMVKSGGKTHSSTSCSGQNPEFCPKALCWALALGLGLGVSGLQAQSVATTALPMGGSVVAGAASISQSGVNMVIDQSSQRSVINWQSFNVGQDARVHFNNAGGATLNRVTGPEASTILGRITAPGQVLISNGNGVFFGRGATVDVGSLVATTHSISNSSFMAGGLLKFERNGSTASVVNEGSLSANLKGFVALLAPEVRNSGVIVATKGTVALAAGEAITLQLNAQDQLQGVVVDAGDWKALVDNRHVVEAEGGLVILSARALQSVQGGVVRHSGSISASSLTEAGGRVLLTGDHIQLSSSSVIAATGTTAGGQVLVGGDWQGGASDERRVFADPSALHQATTVSMAAGASIDASATTNGQGGTVVLWSDVHNANSVTHAAGSIFAKGAGSGGGGQVETSGHLLETPESVRVDTTDAQGRAGVWLLDPYNYTIAASGGQFTGAQLTTLLNSSNIEISTAVSSSAGAAGTSSSPYGRIYVNDSLTVPSGKTLTLKADEFTSTISTSSSPGGIGINNQGTLILDQFLTTSMGEKPFWVPISNTGNITFKGNTTSNNAGTGAMEMKRYLSPSSGSITVSSGSLRIGSDLVLNGKLTLGESGSSFTPKFLITGALATNGGIDFYKSAEMEVTADSVLGGQIANPSNAANIALTIYAASSNTIELNASYSNPVSFNLGSAGSTIKVLNNDPLGNLTNKLGGTYFVDISGTSRTLSSNLLGTGGDLRFTSGKTLILTNTVNDFAGTVHVPDSSTLQVGAGSTGVYKGKVNLVGANSIYHVNSSTSFSSFSTGTITGSGQVIKSGAGTLTLNGNNTYSGATTINFGGITAAHANALGGNSTGTTVLGGFLGLSGGITLAEPIIFDANNTYLSGISGTNIFSGSLVVNGSNLNLDGVGGTMQVSSAITGNFGIVKTGLGTVILNGNNDFTGSVTINGGVLVAAHNNALGSAASGTTVNVTAALGIQGDIALMEPITINGSGFGSSGSLSNRSGSNSLSGPITMTANGQLSSTAGTLTVNAPISGAFNIEKKGLGTVVLAGNNTYSGSTTVTEGTLVAAHSSALGGAANGTSVTSGATLALQGDISIAEPLVLNGTGVVESTVAKGALRNLSGNNTVTGAITLNSASRINSDAGTLTIDVGTGNAITGVNKNIAFGGAGNITVVDAISLGSGTQSIDSTGTVTLPAATLTPTQIGLLTTADVAALSPQQIAAFDNDQMAAFTATQITGLSTSQQAAFLANLNASQLAGMSNTALAAIDPVKLASLGTGMLGSLSSTKMGQLTVAQLIQLSASGLWTELSTTQVAGLTAAQLTGLSSAQVAGFTAVQLGGLTATQLSALSAAQQTTLLSGLTAAKLAGISNAALAAIEPSTLAGFASGKLSSLSAAQIGQFSSAQLIQLSASGLWTELSTTQVAGLTAAQLTGLSSTQVAGFTVAQLGGLTATQLGALSAAQQTILLANLSATKLAGMSNAALAAIEPTTLSGLQPSQLTLLSLAQVNGLTISQRAALLPTQLAVLPVSNNGNSISNNIGGNSIAWKGTEWVNEIQRLPSKASWLPSGELTAQRPNLLSVNVALQSIANAQQTWELAVTVPSQGNVNQTEFEFELPVLVQKSLAYTADPVANMSDGAPLPDWLRFDPLKGLLLVSRSSDLNFPLHLYLVIGNERVNVVMSER